MWKKKGRKETSKGETNEEARKAISKGVLWKETMKGGKKRSQMHCKKGNGKQ